MSYVNLHCHTTFSALDGQMLIRDYLARAKALGQTHAAITDHGTMAGTPEFLHEARRAGIVPIVGMEAYVQPESRLRVHQQRDNFHLTMLAINRTGYDNLSKLATAANSDGFYYKPRVDWELLERYNEGIVVLSGCASGELARAILRDDEPRQEDILNFYMAVFPGRYYLEYQDHGDWADQQTINRRLNEIVTWTGLPRVATNDAHFCVGSDFPAQQLLVAINRKQDLKDVVSGSPTNFVRDNEHMASLFDRDMLHNTLEIAAMVETYPIGDRSPKLPASTLERSGQDPIATMAALAQHGLERRLGVPFGQIPPEYMDRFQYEIEVIADLTRKVGVDFSRYLLIIADICDFARYEGIRFGPRGSAAGSVINWALGISEPDPVRHGLVFERFLNPYRKEMPDVDIDFADSRREEVFAYIRDRYFHVAKIGTYNMIGNKQSIKDAAKAIKGGFSDHAFIAEQLIRLVPHDPRPGGIPLHELVDDPVKGEPIRERMEDDPEIAEIIAGALSIEGRQRGDGMHAGGVVISDRPLEDMLPLSWTNDMLKKKGDVIPFRTQYEMQHLEELGLLKIDILGLKTLSTLQMTLEKIERTYGSVLVPDLWKLDWEDQPTWDLIRSGRTLGLFQIGSDGLGGACFQVQPDSISDLALTGAVYRPGPMQSLQTIIDRKHGRVTVASIHPAIDPLLSETYGVPVYQEQIMGIAQAFAGYDLGQADLLRKAMGKKIREKMAEEWQKFLAGSLRNGHTEHEARTVWDFVEPFADYGFNRAHAVCYAYVAFQTAYLKAHFPLEFYASALTVEATSGGDGSPQERIGSLVREAAKAGFAVDPPSIAFGYSGFDVQDGRIKYGLSCVKDVSEDDVKAIIRNGPFRSLEHLILKGGIKSSKSLKALASVGALDAIGRGHNRRTMVEVVVPALIEYRTAVNKKKIGQGQQSLFATDGLIMQFDWKAVKPVKEYPVAKLLELEQSVTGMFRTPLPQVDVAVTSCSEAQELDGWNVNMLGVLTKVSHAVAKKSGQTMGYATLLDETGQIELVFFHRTYEQVKQHLREGSLVMVAGRLQTSFRGERNMIVDTLGIVDPAAPAELPAQETVAVTVSGDPPEAAQELGRIFDEARTHPGRIRCEVMYETEVIELWIGPLARIGTSCTTSGTSMTTATTA